MNKLRSPLILVRWLPLRTIAILTMVSLLPSPCSPVLFAGEARGLDASCRTARPGTHTIVVEATNGLVSGNAILEAITESVHLDVSAPVRSSLAGQIDLNRSSSRWTLRAISMALPDVTLKVRRHQSGERALIIEVDVDHIRDVVNRTKGRLRSRLVGRHLRDYGLSDLEHPQGSGRGPIAVLVHGYSASRSSMDRLATHLLQNGASVARFEYANDTTIEESATLLRSALHELNDDYPAQSIYVITHSMGGLLARAAIETPGDCNECLVQRLIMVAPPNHGSRWAQVPGGLDWYEVLCSKQSLQGRMRQTVVDGLNQARTDLRPDSAFLRRLNERPYSSRDNYTVIAGSGGPLTPGQHRAAVDHVTKLLARSRAGRFVLPLAREYLGALDEVVIDRGDGVVSVASCRLDGVSDVVVLDMLHCDVTRKGDLPSMQRILEEIDRRISYEKR